MAIKVKEKFSRREMLVHSSGIIAGLMLGSGCRRDISKSPNQGKEFKIGICDWTLGRATDPECVSLASKLGFDGVQVDFGGPEGEALPLCRKELQQDYLRRAREHDIAISSLAMGTLNQYPLKSDIRTEQWLSEGIDTCSAMGLKVILLAFFGNGDLRNDPEGKNNVVAKLKNMAPKAEKAGITLGIESWLDAKEHMDIIERVGSTAVKVYYDVGNSHKCGYDIYEEIRYLGKQICEFHAKDYDGLYGKGTIDFPKVREAMDDIRYRGWIVVEGVQMPLGLEQSCRYDLEYLRTVFPAG